MTIAFVVTCEHGGNRVPSCYREFFIGHEALLHTHRGYDIGALRLARDMAAALQTSLHASTVSRLLIDLNRSLSHPKAFSEVTRNASKEIREEIIQRYYQPYRTKVETRIAQAIEDGARVVHLSCHTFTPELDGEVRRADLGLLYDPARLPEVELCQRWRDKLKANAASLKSRMNYPYTGTADGFTVYLRRRFPADRYIGLELEVNQKHVREGAAHWREVREAVVEAFLEAAAPVTE